MGDQPHTAMFPKNRVYMNRTSVILTYMLKGFIFCAQHSCKGVYNNVKEVRYVHTW